MDINILDEDSCMVVIYVKSPLVGDKINELLKDINDLKDKGAMGFIFDFSQTQYVSSGAISLLSVLAAEATMGNDQLRLFCPNKKIKLNFEMSGLLSIAKMVTSVEEAIEELKTTLFIEGDLGEPTKFKETQVTQPVPAGATPAGPPKAEVVVDRAPHSDAGLTDVVANIFEVTVLKANEVDKQFLMPKDHDNEEEFETETRHYANKNRNLYGNFQKRAKPIIEFASEDNFYHRNYPVRERIRHFLVVQGLEPKWRHILVSVGGLAIKRAKSLSYSAKQALEKYDFEPYFAISVLEPCQLYGEAVMNRTAKGWKFTQYSTRNDAVQKLFFLMLDKILEKCTAEIKKGKKAQAESK